MHGGGTLDYNVVVGRMAYSLGRDSFMGNAHCELRCYRHLLQGRRTHPEDVVAVMCGAGGLAEGPVTAPSPASTAFFGSKGWPQQSTQPPPLRCSLQFPLARPRSACRCYCRLWMMGLTGHQCFLLAIPPASPFMPDAFKVTCHLSSIQ